jgi:hypothetical protein
VDENELATFFDCYTDLPDDVEDFFDAQTAEAVENDSFQDSLYLDDIYVPRIVIDWSIPDLNQLDDPTALLSPSSIASSFG